MGLVSNVFDERTLAGAHRPPRHRPHPLLDDRFEHLAQRPAGLPRRRDRQFALGHNGNLVMKKEPMGMRRSSMLLPEDQIQDDQRDADDDRQQAGPLKPW